MSDDQTLSQWLRETQDQLYGVTRGYEAADRIEKLEAALREIAAGYETPWSTSTVSNMLNVAEILSERINIARKALEGKDGG